MDLQETIVLRIKREIEEAIQLLTTDPKVYKELLTHHRRGTNGGGEPHPRWCLDWIWWFWTLRRLDEYFVDSPRVSGILGYLQSKEAVRGAPEVGTTHQGTPGPPGTPTGASLAHQMSSGPKKSSRSFTAFGLRLILISCDVKNMQKTTTGTWHYVNRLVPKNDIK